jgi:hypothetical protein
MWFFLYKFDRVEASRAAVSTIRWRRLGYN